MNIDECMKDNQIIRNEVFESLNEFGLKSILEKYLELDSIINIDFKDIVCIVHESKIANYYNGNVNFNNPISFNFKENKDSKTLLIIEMNSKFQVKNIERLLLSIKEKLKDSLIIYGCYMNEELEDNQAKVLIINTVNDIEEDVKPNVSFEKELDINYDLDEIARLCKENNNYSINYIQKIAKVGFNHALKIKEKIVNK